MKQKNRGETNFQGMVNTKEGALCDILGYLKQTEMINKSQFISCVKNR